MSTAAAIVLACFGVAGLVWFAATRNGRRLLYVTALAVHRWLVPATGTHRPKDPETGEVLPEETVTVRELLRELAAAASARLRWKLWGLLTRSRRVCPANAHGALIWRTRPVREILVDDECRQDCALNGACWCGNLRAPVAASAPGDGPAPEVAPDGAGPLTDAPGGASPYPAPTAPQPALTEPPNPAPNWAPPVTWTPYAPTGIDVIA